MKKLMRRLVNKETVTYIVFGLLTTAVNYLVYYGLRELDINYLLANVAAWVVAVLFAFFTNKHFVFESHDYSPAVLFPEMGRFAAGRLITLLLEQVFLFFTVDLFKGNDRLMKLLVSVGVVILNYFFSKLFIFKKTVKKEHSDEN